MSRPAQPAYVLATTVVLLSVALAGCSAGGTDDPEPAARFASLEEALEAAGPTLEPAQPADSTVRASIVAPQGYQGLEVGATEFVVVIHDPVDAEPIANATVSLDAGDAATRLVQEGPGVYVGELVVDEPGVRPARLTAIDAEGSSVVFDLDLIAWSSNRDAKEMAGLSFEPVEGNDDLRLKLVRPHDTFGIDGDEQPLTFVLRNAQTGEVVTEAEAEVESWMPPHGLPGGGRMQPHGTHGEVAPTHQRFGVYQGQLNYVMNGTWWTNVTVTVDGETTLFRTTYDIGEGGHSHGDGGHDDGHDHAHGFDTFLGALGAHGPEREMSNLDGSATLTAKLLTPSASGAPTGNQSVRILLSQPEADRPAPVAVADVEIDIHRHTDGGGIEDANTSEIVHSGHGVWTADTDLSEESSWEFHLDIETVDGDVFSGSFQVTVGDASGGGHDHSGHEH